jgi:hypothetical protein
MSQVPVPKLVHISYKSGQKVADRWHFNFGIVETELYKKLPKRPNSAAPKQSILSNRTLHYCTEPNVMTNKVQIKPRVRVLLHPTNHTLNYGPYKQVFIQHNSYSTCPPYLRHRQGRYNLRM